MQLRLLLTDDCPTCLETKRVWQRVCQERGQSLEVLFTDSDIGHELVEHLGLQMFPALLADGRVCAVGAPSVDIARDALAHAMRNPHAAAR